MRIIAIDPGVSTGFVDAEASSGSFNLVRAGTFSWDARFKSLKGLLLSMPRPTKVIVESFRLYAHKSEAQINSDFPSVRVIGLIEAYLEEVGILDRIIFQPASVTSRVQILEEHRAVLQTEHSRDAYKHLRYYVVTKTRPK